MAEKGTGNFCRNGPARCWSKVSQSPASPAVLKSIHEVLHRTFHFGVEVAATVWGGKCFCVHWLRRCSRVAAVPSFGLPVVQNFLTANDD